MHADLVEFTDEEGYGKYLDLHEVYDKFLNLRGVEVWLAFDDMYGYSAHMLCYTLCWQVRSRGHESIAHFRARCLKLIGFSIKARLGAQLFIWKWVKL